MTKRIINCFVKGCLLGVVLIAGLAVYHRANAQRGVVICEPDRNGKICCWDTSIYGSSRPYICN